MQKATINWPSFKVVWTDGYARETVAEHIIAEWLSEEDARYICDKKQNEITDKGDWYKVTPQETPVWRGMEEFV